MANFPCCPGRMSGAEIPDSDSTSMPKVPSDIPVGTQFSPALINLKPFLQALCAHSGNREALQAAVWKPPVHRKRITVPSSHRTANLPLDAAVQYRLLEGKTYTVTDLARQLVKLSGQELREAFARHILLNLGGLRVVEAVEQMQLDRDAGLSDVEVTGDSLARHLSAQGFRVTEHNTAINSMRMWLAEAGLFSQTDRRGNVWKIDPVVKEKLVGLTDNTVAILAGLTPTQRAFVDALCRINPSGWCKASDVRDLAETASGVRFGRASLPKEILEPLRQAGLIEYKTKGTKGGKTAVLKTTAAFDKNVVQPFVINAINSLDPVVTQYYRTRPEDIYAALNSSNTFVKGRALEAYAIHIMRLLGLRFIEWRKRGPDTGGAEIDATLAGLLGSVPTVWQVQCKNIPTRKVRLEDVSKEVGQVPTTRATIVMIIANGEITRDATKFAMMTMRNSPLTIFLLGKAEFEAVRKSPAALGPILRAQAEQIVWNRTR